MRLTSRPLKGAGGEVWLTENERTGMQFLYQHAQHVPQPADIRLLQIVKDEASREEPRHQCPKQKPGIVRLAALELGTETQQVDGLMQAPAALLRSGA